MKMMTNARSLLGISTNTSRAPFHYPKLQKLLSIFSNGFHHQRNSQRALWSNQNLQKYQSGSPHGLTVCTPISSRPRNQCLLQRHLQCLHSETTGSIERELLPFVRIYKDGTVERLMGSPYDMMIIDN